MNIGQIKASIMERRPRMACWPEWLLLLRRKDSWRRKENLVL